MMLPVFSHNGLQVLTCRWLRSDRHQRVIAINQATSQVRLTNGPMHVK